MFRHNSRNLIIPFLLNFTKIAKGECRDKRKIHFQFGYAEPHPIFVLTKIAKGERRDKRKIHFRFDYAEPHPIFVSTKIATLTIHNSTPIYPL